MANQEQLALLRCGAEDWNQWRTENPEVNIDLSGADLYDADLSGADLIDADLRGADLRGADLRGACFFGADLSGADLYNADLRGTQLCGTIFDKKTRITPKWRIVHGLVNDDRAYKDLSDADLSDANLICADLSNADLSNAALRYAVLSAANLIGTNLIGADFSYADLSHADLTATQSLTVDFTGAIFTGACLEDWNVNSKTKLDNVICEYVYLKRNEKERRPSSGSFKPGEFTALFQKALETVDLIFADGIDWKAFFASFQELRAKHGDDNLSIQAIEKKSGGAFVIRLEVPAEADKVAIESGFKERYEMQLQLREELYRVNLHAKDREIEIYKQKGADLMEIVILQASRPINVEAKALVDQSKSETFSNDYRGANIANNANKITGNARQIASQFSQNSGQSLDEIIKLINSLRETAQAFSAEQREETLGHLGDLEDDLKQPSNDRTPRRIKATLAALLAIAGMVAASTDFSNNVLEISNKLGIELIQPHKQQLPPSSK